MWPFRPLKASNGSGRDDDVVVPTGGSRASVREREEAGCGDDVGPLLG